MRYPALAVEDLITQVRALKQEFPQLEDDEELLADTLEGETDLHRLIEKLVTSVRENDMLAEALAARGTAIRERQTRTTMRMNFYRGLIHRLLEHTGVRSVPTTEGKVSVVSSPDKVIITDESAIPEQFMRVKKEPDKTSIKAALKSGDNVPGASLSNGGTTITIR